MPNTIASKVVRLETLMDDQKAQLNRLENKVDAMVVSLNNMTILDNKVQDLECQLKELKTHQTFYTWLYPAIGIVIGSTITFLIETAIRK